MPVTSGPFTLALGAAVLLGCGGSSGNATGSGGAGAGGGAAGAGGAGGTANPNLARFSFFVVSLGAVHALSGDPDGFGGDLRHGETGAGAGLRGADKICAETAERSMAGAGAKTWRAFLSATTGGAGGGPVHAKDRVGAGPWYDAAGRLVASTLAQLLMDRPGDADLAIKNDLPNEYGIPNHMDGAPGCSGATCPNNHAVLTGTGPDGMLYTAVTPATDSTCNDWTSAEAAGQPRSGHSWPRTGESASWISAAALGGCAPCTGAGTDAGTSCVGATGGYGGFYCFAVTAP
jgi:hypothetical protein